MSSKATQSPIKLHQALYGYRDGHRQLATSKKLLAPSRRKLLVLSDLSGSSFVEGFDGYITGFPLSEAQTYALAKTWYAPEMPRPGCVWTHVLLIDFSDLARIHNLASLTRFFKRPDKQPSHNTSVFTGYSEALELDPNANSSLPSIWNLSLEETSRFVQVVYEKPDQPALVETDAEQDLQNAVLALWTQQWPRLRRTFTFCTGSISIRKLDGGTFDLQIVPRGRVSSATRQGFTIWNLTQNPSHSSNYSDEYPDTAEWVQLTARNLQVPGRRSLYAQLRAFGADVPGRRSSFLPLVHILQKISEANTDSDLYEFADLLAKHFPNRENARRLKEWVFGRRYHNEIETKVASLQRPPAAEHELLAVLLTTSHIEAFDPESLQLGDRLRHVIAHNEQETVWITLKLLKKNRNEWGENAIGALLDAISLDDLFSTLKDNPSAVTDLLIKRPSFFTTPALWDTSPEITDIAMDVLISKAVDVPWPSVIEAMLQAGYDRFAGEVEKLAGQAAAKVVLQWKASHQASVPNRWRRVVQQHPQAFLEWLSTSPPPEATADLMPVFSPYQLDLSEVPPDLCVSLAQELPREHLREADLNLAAFILAVGFMHRGSASQALISSTFEPVYRAAKNKQLGRDASKWLDPFAPTNKGWTIWKRADLSHTLLETLADRIAKEYWPNHELRKTVQSEHIRAALSNTVKNKTDRANLDEAFGTSGK